MKIAMLHPSLTWRGGAERQILILAAQLQQKGHEVEIFTCALNDSCYPELVKTTHNKRGTSPQQPNNAKCNPEKNHQATFRRKVPRLHK